LFLKNKNKNQVKDNKIFIIFEGNIENFKVDPLDILRFGTAGTNNNNIFNLK
jgi:hypothetical protein